jgi:hypothetical protein
MAGLFKPVAFDPYGRRRSRRGVPRWLVLIVLGAVLGIAGLIYVQERLFGPRLSLSDSNALRQSFVEADSARKRLTDELKAATTKMEAALTDKKKSDDDLASAKGSVKALQEDLGSIVATLPPDPRGGAVQIRAGWLALKGNTVSYDLVLTRDRSSSTPTAASLQFSIAGETAGGTPRTITPAAVPASIGNQEIIRGSLNLPVDFKPQQATISIADRASNKALGMRVLLVK